MAQAQADAQASWAQGARDPAPYSYEFPGMAPKPSTQALCHRWSWYAHDYNAEVFRSRNRVALWGFRNEWWGDEGVNEPTMTMDHYARPIRPQGWANASFNAYGSGMTESQWQQVLNSSALTYFDDWYRSTGAWGGDYTTLPVPPWPADPAYNQATIAGWELESVPSGVEAGQDHYGEFAIVHFTYDQQTP
jgi:hypothetical protein